MPLVFGRSIFGFAVVAGPPAPTWTDPDLTYTSYDSVSLNIATEEPIPTGLTFSTDGTNAYIAGPNNDTVYQYSLSTAWDLSTASYASKSLSVSGQAALSGAIQFKDDGTSLYVLDRNLDDVFQYDLTTAWDVSTASYASKSMDATSEDTAPRGMYFKTDGTKVYIAGDTTNSIYQYALSTAWDISTGSFETGKSFSVGTQTTIPCGVYFSPNGDKMWVASTADGDIYQYSLSTAWDVSTASYDSVSFDASTQVTTGFHDLYFKSDGSKMYLISNSTDAIFQYSTVAPAWSADLSSASYDNVSFSVASQDNTSPLGLAFNNNGTKMYFLGGFADTIYQYSLSTAFDVSTASYDTVSFSVQTQDTNSFNLTFNNNGTKMYTVGATGDSVYQYSLSTSFDLSTASYDSVSFSVASQDITPYDVAFGSSGTKMYIVGFNNDTLYQYSLSTAYDLSTASYDSVSFSVATQEIQPTDFAISSDGTEIYVVGLANDTVYKYTLSTAWDLSTAAYSNVSFSVASQETLPRSVTFNSSGSKMYILGSTNKSVFQYSTVASAWTNPDIANASYDSVSFSVATQEGNPRSVTFNSDGSKMFVLGTSSSGQVYQYSLSTSWNPSSATYDSISFGVGSQETSPISIVFKSDGSSFYIAGSNNTVYQYDLTTAYDLSTASYASKSLSTGITNTRGLSISTDGTKLWAVGSGGTIQQFTMSTAWDVSTASSDSKSLDVSARGSSTSGLYVSDDGSAVYINNLGTDTIYEYDLSTNYDISTGTYNSVSFSVASEETTPWGFTFKNDGSKMYVIGNVSDKIFQYST